MVAKGVVAAVLVVSLNEGRGKDLRGGEGHAARGIGRSSGAVGPGARFD
jgi:hypothetical protein